MKSWCFLPVQAGSPLSSVSGSREVLLYLLGGSLIGVGFAQRISSQEELRISLLWVSVKF